jgi:hypothetical protein
VHSHEQLPVRELRREPVRRVHPATSPLAVSNPASRSSSACRPVKPATSRGSVRNTALSGGVFLPVAILVVTVGAGGRTRLAGGLRWVRW